MKKKLIITFIAAVIVMALAQQGITSADYVLPRITSIQGPTSFALSN